MVCSHTSCFGCNNVQLPIVTPVNSSPHSLAHFANSAAHVCKNDCGTSQPSSHVESYQRRRSMLTFGLAGSSFILYAGTGFFGAALFGANTYGNVMLNNITNSTAGCLVAYSCMLLYLAAGAAACQFPLRASVDLLILGEHAPMTTARSVSN
eukprot:GHRR01028483.1.p1 GENE.GHRR01028483.1~~GHRR01028483.1.p1  ORF type:complete len:152 (-),score=40.72 GHRR01028483.1:307-762(-)